MIPNPITLYRVSIKTFTLVVQWFLTLSQDTGFLLNLFLSNSMIPNPITLYRVSIKTLNLVVQWFLTLSKNTGLLSNLLP